MPKLCVRVERASKIEARVVFAVLLRNYSPLGVLIQPPPYSRHRPISPALLRSVGAFTASIPFRGEANRLAGGGRRGGQSSADAFYPRARGGEARCEDEGARASSYNAASGDLAGSCELLYGFDDGVGAPPLPSGAAYEKAAKGSNTAAVQEDASCLDDCFAAAGGRCSV